MSVDYSIDKNSEDYAENDLIIESMFLNSCIFYDLLIDEEA
mgnify:CR=1 FL=1